jgi:hypothetical protein
VLSSSSKRRGKRGEERETSCPQKHGEIREGSSTSSLMTRPFLTYYTSGATHTLARTWWNGPDSMVILAKSMVKLPRQQGRKWSASDDTSSPHLHHWWLIKPSTISLIWPRLASLNCGDQTKRPSVQVQLKWAHFTPQFSFGLVSESFCLVNQRRTRSMVRSTLINNTRTKILPTLDYQGLGKRENLHKLWSQPRITCNQHWLPLHYLYFIYLFCVNCYNNTTVVFVL